MCIEKNVYSSQDVMLVACIMKIRRWCRSRGFATRTTNDAESSPCWKKPAPLSPKLLIDLKSTSALETRELEPSLESSISRKTHNSVVGVGGFATIVKIERNTSDPGALKLLHDNRRLLHELEILRHVQGHPNIVPLLSPKDDRIIMKLADDDMFNVIMKNTHLIETVARCVFLQMISAIRFCHEREVVHRDIKLENWLVKGDRIWLCDFGLACGFKRGQSRLDGRVGSLAYAAPEVLEGRTYNGPMVDAWSVLVCLFAMLHGYFPYERATPEDWRFAIFFRKCDCLTDALSGAYGRTCELSNDGKDLIHRVLGVDETQRLSIEDIGAHAWCSGATCPISSVSS